VSLQPVGNRLSIPTFDKIDWSSGFQVNEDRGVGLASTQRQIAGWKSASSHDAKHSDCRDCAGFCLSLETQESVGADWQAVARGELRASLTASCLDDLEQMVADLAGSSGIPR
jgi:hypothetical protein